MVPNDEEKPEDSIPDLPENQQAREFLKKAPTKGLWMPLGKEVKVMQCWRCKAFGHRTGDKECPMKMSGNFRSESMRKLWEDPMATYVNRNDEEKERIKEEKLERIRVLKEILEQSKKEKKRKRSKHHHHQHHHKDIKKETHKRHSDNTKHKKHSQHTDKSPSSPSSSSSSSSSSPSSPSTRNSSGKG